MFGDKRDEVKGSHSTEVQKSHEESASPGLEEAWKEGRGAGPTGLI